MSHIYYIPFSFLYLSHVYLYRQKTKQSYVYLCCMKTGRAAFYLTHANSQSDKPLIRDSETPCFVAPFVNSSNSLVKPISSCPRQNEKVTKVSKFRSLL